MKKACFALFLCTVFMVSSITVNAEIKENAQYEIEILLDAQYKAIHLDESFIYAMNPVEDGMYHPDAYIVTIFDYQLNQIVPPIYRVEYCYSDSDTVFFTEDRMRVEKDSKFGFIDTAGTLVVDTIYDSVGDFKDGLSIVMKDGLWGVIDYSGNVLVDFLYSYIDPFSDGKAIAQKDGVMGILDISNSFLELPYAYLSSIKNGCIFAGTNPVKGSSYGDRITLESAYESIEGDFGFIDTEGNVAYPFVLKANRHTDLTGISMTGPKYKTFFDASYFSEEGIAFIKQDIQGKFGIISRSGELLYDFVLDEFEAYPNYYIGKQGEQWVFLDKQGHEIKRSSEYLDIQSYRKNPLYSIILDYDYEYGIISNWNGEVLLPPEYYEIYAVNDGAAIVQKTPDYRNSQLIDIYTQETLLEGFVSPINERLIYFYNKDDNTVYLADWRGHIISKIDWKPYDVSRILPKEIINKENYIRIDTKSSLNGVMDKYGNIIIEPTYKYINDDSTIGITHFELPLIEGKNHSPYPTDNENKSIKTDYFDYDGNQVYYCTDSATYTADNVEIYDFPVILSYHHPSYHNVCVFKNENNLGLVRINRTKPAVAEAGESLYMKLFIGGPIFIANGRNYPTDQENTKVVPVIENDRTLVPIRVISETMGAEVSWDESEKKVTITKEGKEISLWIDNKNVLVNGEPLELDAAPAIRHSRTFVPLRFVSEALGANVEWKDETQAIIITKDDVTLEDPLASFVPVSHFDNISSRLRKSAFNKMGDSYYNWSMNIPKELPLSICAPDGTYIEFSIPDMSKIISLRIVPAAENDTFDAIKERELEYIKENRLISQDFEETKSRRKYLRTVYEYDYMGKIFRGDSRMILNNGYLYSLYCRTFSDNPNDISKYVSIADSFDFTYDQAVTEPLQPITDGYRQYSSAKFKVAFSVPESWIAVPEQNQIKPANQITFVSGKEETASMIELSIFSASPEETVEQLAKRKHNAYLKLYEDSEQQSSELLPITIGGHQGVYYTDTIKQGNKTFYRYDIFFCLGEYSYNFSITLQQKDEALIKKVLDSFAADELDSYGIWTLEEPQNTN